MARLSPKLETLCDLRKNYWSHRRGGYWHGEPTLTAGRAKEIVEAGRAATGLIGMSKVNKALTLEQSYGILLKCSDNMKDDEPLHFLAAKNVLREFGRFYKEPAPTSGGAENSTQQSQERPCQHVYPMHDGVPIDGASCVKCGKTAIE